MRIFGQTQRAGWAGPLLAAMGCTVSNVNWIGEMPDGGVPGVVIPDGGVTDVTAPSDDGPADSGQDAAEPFDPATQPLTWWARAPYVYASQANPLVGLPSAGSSGTKQLGYNGAPPTRTGFALNGLEGMAGDGHFNSFFRYDPPYLRMGDFISLNAYTVGILVKAGAPNDDAWGKANEYPTYAYPPNSTETIFQRGVIYDGIGLWGLYYVPNGGNSGLYTLSHFDGESRKEVSVEGALEEVLLIQFGYDGSHIWIQKNHEPVVKRAAGPLHEYTPGYFVDAGTWWEFDTMSTAHFGGVRWEVWSSDRNLYSERDNIRCYINARYAGQF